MERHTRESLRMVVDMVSGAIEIVMVNLFVKVIGKMTISYKQINEKS